MELLIIKKATPVIRFWCISQVVYGFSQWYINESSIKSSYIIYIDIYYILISSCSSVVSIFKTEMDPSNLYNIYYD